MPSLYFLLILFTEHMSSIRSFWLPPVKEYSYRGSTSMELFSLAHPSSYRHRRSEDCTPDHIGVRFTADQQPVELLLQRNYDVNVNAPLFVNRNGRIAQEILNDSENVAVYHDLETGSAIIIECISRTRKYKLFGTVFNGSEELIIQPEILEEEKKFPSASRNDHQRRKTKSNDLKNDISKFSISNHIIYKRKAFRPMLSDFIQEAYMQPKYQANSDHSARVKRAVAAYEVELLMVADYSVYKFWLDKSSTGAEAKELLRQFYAFVLNGMDLRYKSVSGSSFSITILFAGLYIAETQSDAFWTEERTVPSGYPYQVNASAALNDFSTWIQNITDLPEHDHAILFTAYDLVANNGNSTPAGLVYVNSTCTAYSQSVVEDHFDAKMITVAAHILGHSLGSNHDGTLDGTGDLCSPTLSYIMAASEALSDTGPSDFLASTNVWKFSSCSISYFQAYINRLNRTNCLTTASLRYNSTALSPFDQQHPGQVYSADTQCQYTQGNDSYFCRNIYNGNFTNMCAAFYCKVSRSIACAPSIAAERTTCGDRKWCVAGECVAAAEAPSVIDTCPFGNQPGIVVDGKQCTQLVANSSLNCYNYTGSCCESCQNAYTGIIGCEYGDKTSGCIAGDCAQYDFYKLKLCCETCNGPPTITTETRPPAAITSSPIKTTMTATSTTTILTADPTTKTMTLAPNTSAQSGTFSTNTFASITTTMAVYPTTTMTTVVHTKTMTTLVPTTATTTTTLTTTTMTATPSTKTMTADPTTSTRNGVSTTTTTAPSTNTMAVDPTTTALTTTITITTPTTATLKATPSTKTISVPNTFTENGASVRVPTAPTASSTTTMNLDSTTTTTTKTSTIRTTTATPTTTTTVLTTITSTAATTLTTTTEESAKKKIEVTVQLSFNVPSSDDFSDRNTSSRYVDMVRDALIDYYTRKVAEGIQIIILDIRRGSLIVDYATIFNSTQETFVAMAKAMVVLAAGGNIILDGQVTSVLYMTIDNYTVPFGGSSKDQLCSVYTVISGVCPDNYTCVVFNDSPVCQPKENTTCTNQSAFGSMCIPCAAGSYQFRLGQRLEGGSSCTSCAEGYYNSKAGDESCRPCEIGSFQNSTGQSSCFPCPKEYTTEQTGEQSEEACFREHCPEYKYAINISTYTVSVTIPPTRISQTGYSWNRCKNDSSKAIVSAFCQNITRTEVKWVQEQILEYCVPEQPEQPEQESYISSQLHNISKIDVNENNLIKILQETNTLIQLQEELTSTDIGYLADILGKVSAVDNISKEITNEVLETFNTLLKSNSSTIQSAQASSGAANRILNTMEDITNKVEGGTDENPVMIIKPKIALSVWEQVGDSLIGIKVLHGDEHSIQNNSLIRLSQEPQDTGLVDDAIYFQSDLLNGTQNKLRMTVIWNDVLFKTGSERYKVVSKIMAAKLFQNGVSITLLGEHYVRAAFHSSAEDSGVVCGYWDYKLNQNGGGWASDGCRHTTDQKMHICTCNHLTNFALLLDLEAKSIPPEHEQALELITYVGLILSIIGLSLTILTFLCFRNLRRGRGQQTLFCLSIPMLCYSVIFLVGIKRTEYYAPCIVVSVLIHYFTLAAFMWMLMEGVLQYLRFVKILGTYIPHFLIKTLIPAWGIPLIPVIVLLAYDYDMYYGGLGFCWMKLDALYYAFVIPICLIILVNAIIFIIVILRICRRPKGMTSNQSEWKRSVLNIKAALSIFVVLGLTWIFGVVALGGAKLIFQYIFVFLNAFQGFFIFLLFTAREKQARDQWLRLCSRKPTGYFTSCGQINSSQDTLLATMSGRNQHSSVTDNREHSDIIYKNQKEN